jgi:methyl coenzyme M reductase system, component A2
MTIFRRDVVMRIAIMLQRTFALYGRREGYDQRNKGCRDVRARYHKYPKAADLLDEFNMPHRMMHVARERAYRSW